MHTTFSYQRLFIVASCIALLGAGCLGSSSKTQSGVPSNALRQPAPPAVPTSPPEIPAEATNVPRPY
ncbi:MAG: hypothetical protein AAB386_00615 [Patescibacteria group bacterium]